MVWPGGTASFISAERSLIPLQEYLERSAIQVPSSVTDGMKRGLIEKGHVEKDFFNIISV